MKRLLLGLAILAMVACDTVTGPSKVVIISFTADTVSLAKNQCTTLRWESAGGDIARIDTNIGVPIGSVETTGTAQACPFLTTVYTLNVKKGNSTPMLRNLTIIVQ